MVMTRPPALHVRKFLMKNMIPTNSGLIVRSSAKPPSYAFECVLMDSNSTPSYYKTNELLHKSILAMLPCKSFSATTRKTNRKKASGNATLACCKCIVASSPDPTRKVVRGLETTLQLQYMI